MRRQSITNGAPAWPSPRPATPTTTTHDPHHHNPRPPSPRPTTPTTTTHDLHRHDPRPPLPRPTASTATTHHLHRHRHHHDSQPPPPYLLTTSQDSESDSSSSTNPSVELTDTDRCHARLAPLDGFPPLPPHPHLLHSEPEKKVDPSKQYQSGIMMAAQRIKANLYKEEPERSSFTHLNQPSPECKPIPG